MTSDYTNNELVDQDIGNKKFIKKFRILAKKDYMKTKIYQCLTIENILFYLSRNIKSLSFDYSWAFLYKTNI